MRNMTKRRRALMSSSSHHGGLPTGYIEVEWLQSSGTQYCDTGIQPIYTSTNFTSIKGDITVLDKIQSQFELSSRWYQNYSSVSSEFAYGIRYTYTQTNPLTNKSEFLLYYGLLSAANASYDVTNFVFPLDIHYEINRNNLIINQSTIPRFSEIQYNAPYGRTLLIGAYYTGYSANPIAIYNRQIRVKTLLIYNNDTLIYKFVPCYRASDNKTGFMKITIADNSTEFIPNLGEDEWIIGTIL